MFLSGMDLVIYHLEKLKGFIFAFAFTLASILFFVSMFAMFR